MYSSTDLAIVDAEFTVTTTPNVNMAKLQWYMFDQNNSGGSFDYDKNVSEKVIIQAVDRHHATARAEEIGVYFDGCCSGQDCPCCGDRWYAPWDDDGTDELPLLGNFGENGWEEVTIDEYVSSFTPAGERPVRIHYMNGNIHSAGTSRRDLKE